MSADLVSYRLDQADLKADKAEARMVRIEETMNDIKLILAKMPTKGDLLNYIVISLGLGLAVIAIVIGGLIGGLNWIKVH